MKNLDASFVTVIVVPRDRYSALPKCVESILKNTKDISFRLLIMEGDSGEKTRTYLRALSKEDSNVEVAFHDYLLTEEKARNLALERVKTKWIAFVDSDVEVLDGWLGALVRCGEEENAALVSPLILENSKHVHCGACFFDFTQENGETLLSKRMMYYRRRITNLPELKRERADFAETHCFAINRELLPDAILSDESIQLSDYDIGMTLRQRNLLLFAEPKARVNFLPPPSVQPMDFPQYKLKWSAYLDFDERMEAFRQKWNVRIDPKGARSMKNVFGYYHSLLTPFMEQNPSRFVASFHNYFYWLRLHVRLFGRDTISFFEKIFKGESRKFVR